MAAWNPLCSWAALRQVLPIVLWNAPSTEVGGGRRNEAVMYEWVEDSDGLLQEWIDHKLSWNPEEYGGITAIRVPSESLWLPDIVLFEKWVSWLLTLGLGGQSLGKAGQPPWSLHVLSEGFPCAPGVG